MTIECMTEDAEAESLRASGKRINMQFKERVALHEAIFGKYKGTDDWGPADANCLMPQATARIAELEAKIEKLNGKEIGLLQINPRPQNRDT